MLEKISFFKAIRRWIWSRIMLFQRGMTIGVRVIAINSDGHVLMVRHGYTPGWHVPGGGVDYRETMDRAARREVLEETGYQVDGELKLLGLAYNHNQWKGDHVAVYVANSISKVRDIKPSFEIEEIGFFSLDNLPEGTTKGTRARLAEWQAGEAVSAYWS
ncbi:MAG: NUDIX domain-containing protein [Devosiaceae bacterium]